MANPLLPGEIREGEPNGLQVEIRFGEDYQTQNNPAAISKLLGFIGKYPDVTSANLSEEVVNAFGADNPQPVLHTFNWDYFLRTGLRGPGRDAMRFLNAFEANRFMEEVWASINNSGIEPVANIEKPKRAGEMFGTPIHPKFKAIINDILQVQVVKPRDLNPYTLNEASDGLHLRIKRISDGWFQEYTRAIQVTARFSFVGNLSDFDLSKIDMDAIWGLKNPDVKPQTYEDSGTNANALVSDVYLPIDLKTRELKMGDIKVVVFQGEGQYKYSRNKDGSEPGIFRIYNAILSKENGKLVLVIMKEVDMSRLRNASIELDLEYKKRPSFGSLGSQYSGGLFRFMNSVATSDENGKPFWYDQVLGGDNNKKLLTGTV